MLNTRQKSIKKGLESDFSLRLPKRCVFNWYQYGKDGRKSQLGREGRAESEEIGSNQKLAVIKGGNVGFGIVETDKQALVVEGHRDIVSIV